MSQAFSTYSGPSALSVVLGALVSLCLAVTLFAAGFAVCALQPTTQLLSRMFSNFGQCAYPAQDAISLAVATRDFTVEPYRDGQAKATEKLAEHVVAAARRAKVGEAGWEAQAGSVPQMYALAQQSSRYAFGPDEISHLIDCNKLINAATPVLIVIAVIALGGSIALGVSCSRKALGRSLVAAPALLASGMVALAIWAIVDFDGFFTAFHGLLFPQGNWTFPADSLLICLLPTPFWVCMAALWIAVTLLSSIICIAIGLRLKRP